MSLISRDGLEHYQGSLPICECLEQVAEVSILSRDDMERIIADGIAREYPAENRDERITMAELLNEPVETSQSIADEGLDLDM